MARPLRIEYPGALYHVMARGNARLPIYESPNDKRMFLALLAETVERFNWLCHSYCLMENHYHLLVETLDPNLSQGMRHLGGVYTQRFNRRHDRTGHLFQGRYKAILVEKEAYLLELCRYIVLNPVRAGFAARPEDHAWSSYRATSGLIKRPAFLSVRWLLDAFGSDPKKAKAEYRRFVQAGMDTPAPEHGFVRKTIIGSREFVQSLKSRLTKSARDREIPKAQRYLHRPALSDLIPESLGKSARNKAMAAACLEYGYRQKEVADHVGLHYSWVSRVIKRTKSKT